MTEKELDVVFNCIIDEETLEFETIAKMYNYIRKLGSEIKQLQNTIHNTAYTKCLESLEKELLESKAVMLHRGEVVNLIRKHFA